MSKLTKEEKRIVESSDAIAQVDMDGRIALIIGGEQDVRMLMEAIAFTRKALTGKDIHVTEEY